MSGLIVPNKGFVPKVARSAFIAPNATLVGDVEIAAPEAGWYDTGDIVDIDTDGFVTILGRAKRFAKLAGEMVSLTAVENALAALWPEAQHAVVAVSDPRKGEALALVTTAQDVTRERLAAGFRERGLAELMIPRTVIPVDAIPLLGSGKTDYKAVQALAEQADHAVA